MAAVKIYTRRLCGYCFAAERLLRERDVAYEEIDVTGNREMRAWLVKETGQTTVPQIFIDGRSIGGYDELRVLDRSGELERLLGA